MAAGLTYHVTQRGVNQENVFFSNGDRNVYLALAEKNVIHCQVQVLAWCLMKNHVHWVLRAGRDNSLAMFFRRVHGHYAQYFNPRVGRKGHLWQNRFFSCPLGPSHLWNALRYVESNPVRAGIVKEDHAYRWSSARAPGERQAAEAKKIVDWDLRLEVDGVEISKQSAVDSDYFQQVIEIRECTYAGKPYGDTQFVEDVQERFGRQWRPVGRPKAQDVPKREMGTERSGSSAQLQISTGSG